MDIIYHLLTKREGRTVRISARGRRLDNTDLTQRGPYRKGGGPIFPQYGPEQARSTREFFMQTKFIVSLCKPLQRTNRARDLSGHYPVQHLENIGPATEHSDWPILVPSGCLSRVITKCH